MTPLVPIFIIEDTLENVDVNSRNFAVLQSETNTDKTNGTIVFYVKKINTFYRIKN